MKNFTFDALIMFLLLDYFTYSHTSPAFTHSIPHGATVKLSLAAPLVPGQMTRTPVSSHLLLGHSHLARGRDFQPLTKNLNAGNACAI